MQLVLIPSKFELSLCGNGLQRLYHIHNIEVRLCGVGLIQSAVNTMRWLDQLQPSNAWLLGIAGVYGDSLPLGSAHEFHRVHLDGIGVGQGDDFQSALELGWETFVDSPIGLGQALVTSGPARQLAAGQLDLVTVAAASATAHEANCRQTRYSPAHAEDMEGYAVASACNIAGVPLRIVRGISNRCGNRDHQTWCSESAMQSAVELLAQIM